MGVDCVPGVVEVVIPGGHGQIRGADMVTGLVVSAIRLDVMVTNFLE